MTTKTLLIGLSPNAKIKWGTLSFDSLLLDVQAIEKRIAAGSNVGEERKRYALTRDRIEFLLMYNALLGKDKQVQMLKIDLGNEYLFVLDQLVTLFSQEAEESGIGRSILIHNQIAQHLKTFSSLVKKAGLQDNPAAKTRVRFLQEVIRRRMIVVEIVNPAYFAEVTYSETNFERILSLFRQKEVITEETPDPNTVLSSFRQLKVADQPTEFHQKSKLEITREALQKALDAVVSGQEMVLNLGNFDWGENDPNDIVTECLHEFVFPSAIKGVKSPLYVPVVYMDGSMGESFPFYAFKDAQTPGLKKEIFTLNVGMISDRHPELDSVVDIYWLRNQEISGKGVGAETDEISYKQSKNLFAQMRTEGDYNIAFYQTGLFPALIGFYRALVEELIFRRNGNYPILRVTPMYFRGGTNYEQGSVWS
jgi:hypothetical protein